MKNYTLYVIDNCKYCDEAQELIEQYAEESGIDYEIVKAETLIEPHPQDKTLVKRSFALFSKDKKERYDLPAVPCIWKRDSNELIVGLGAIDYLKQKSGDAK